MKKLTYMYVILSFIVIQGCTVHLKNLTPPEFPYVSWRDAPQSTYYPQTYNELRGYTSNPEHRFLLEVKPENVSNVRAVVNVNGQDYQMDGSGGGLWKYESTNKCQQEYNYWYHVHYKAGWYGNKVKNVGSAAQPLNVKVSSYGHESWFVPGQGVQTGDGSIRIQAFDSEYIVVQNTAPYPVRIIQFWFYTRPGEPNDNAKFELLDLPTLPHQLNCGASVKVRVHWKTEPPDYSDKAYILLNMSKDPAGTGNYQAGLRAIIDITGYMVP
jgi:hypothetical protein